MNPAYPFNLIRPEFDGPLPDPAVLSRRPGVTADRSLATEAPFFIPGEALVTAMNAAIAVAEPLLITGEPGTGKTQAAYYAAHRLGTRVFHFQVKSETTAGELLYHFDTVRYFHDAHLANIREDSAPLDKTRYVEPRALWQAFDYGREQGRPAVLLIDEIDKAPRDFPNDLLHELDQMEFLVVETGERIRPERTLAPILFITSNSERRLPEPFLRRCVYHHIAFDPEVVRRAVAVRAGQFDPLGPELTDLAIRAFLAIRRRSLRKRPATGELLVWLRVLALAMGVERSRLEQALKDQDLTRMPYLGALLKDHKDLEETIGGGAAGG